MVFRRLCTPRPRACRIISAIASGLRDRFLGGGPDAVTDYELLELILFRAIPRRDVKPLAKALIARFGSFAEVVSAERPRLREIDGLDEAAIAEIKIVQAAANRLARGVAKKGRH